VVKDITKFAQSNMDLGIALPWRDIAKMIKKEKTCKTEFDT
jgi:hypothetical protein